MPALRDVAGTELTKGWGGLQCSVLNEMVWEFKRQGQCRSWRPDSYNFRGKVYSPTKILSGPFMWYFKLINTKVKTLLYSDNHDWSSGVEE